MVSRSLAESESLGAVPLPRLISLSATSGEKRPPVAQYFKDPQHDISGNAAVRGWINHVRYGDTWGLRRTVLKTVRLGADQRVSERQA